MALVSRLAMSDALVEEAFTVRNKSMEAAIFRSLVSTELAQEIAATKRCLFIGFVKEVVDDHADEADGLSNKAPQGKIRLAASLAAFSVKRLESWCSGVRR